MSLVAHALIDLVTLKTALGISSTNEDVKLEQALNHAADRVQREADRRLKSFTSVDRYDGHDRPLLLLREFPVISVNSLVVNEVAQTVWQSESDGEPNTKDVMLLINPNDPTLGAHSLYRPLRWPLGVRNIKISMTAGYGGVMATLTTTFAGSQNNIAFVAVKAGSQGNSITIAFVIAGLNTPLSVAVVGNAITINVATDGAGAATSTAVAVRSAVAASAAASALVVPSLKAGEDGTGVVGALSATALSGGTADNAPPIPEDLKEATIYLAAVAYKRRDMRSWDTTTLSIAGQSITMDPDRLIRRATELIRPYRRPEAMVA